MKRSARIYLLFLLPALLLAGCIREDLSECPSWLKIYFEYPPAANDAAEIDVAAIKSVTLFAFDAADGTLRGLWEDNAPVFTPDYSMTVSGLAAGDYRFIAWCGDGSYYSFSPDTFVPGVTRFDQAFFILGRNGDQANAVFPTYHAEKRVTVARSKEQKAYLPLRQVHNTIHLTTEGLPHSDEAFRMTVYDNNGRYAFDYSFASDSDFNYSAPCAKDAQGQLSGTLRTLKLSAGRSPVFELYNRSQGRALYRADLLALISRMGTFDYDTVHTFNIHLRFTTDLKATIYINGWQVTEDEAMLYH